MRQMFSALTSTANKPEPKKEPTLLNDLFTFMREVKLISGSRFSIGTTVADTIDGTLTGQIEMKGRKSGLTICAARANDTTQFYLAHHGTRDKNTFSLQDADQCVARMIAISQQQVSALPERRLKQLAAQQQMQ